MKVLNKVFMGAAMLVLLTACGPQKVNAEKFQAKIDALEEHQYQEAVVKYQFDIVGTGVMEEVTDNSKGEAKFTWQDTGWVAEKAEDAKYASYLYTIKGTKIDDEPAEDIPEGVDYSVTYYVNPLQVVSYVNGTGTMEIADGVNGEMTMNKCKDTIQFDKYGYMVKETAKVDISMKASVGGVSFEGTQKGSYKITVSYK